MTKSDQHLGAVEHQDEERHGFVAFENLPGMPMSEKPEQIVLEVLREEI